jgi:hypothetical protein
MMSATYPEAVTHRVGAIDGNDQLLIGWELTVRSEIERRDGNNDDVPKIDTVGGKGRSWERVTEWDVLGNHLFY